MLWRVEVINGGREAARIQVASYMEFGLLEFLREAFGWCYLKNQFELTYDPGLHAIRYDYHVFEAPHAPRMLFGCTEAPSGWDCSRDRFLGPNGSLERPAALAAGADLNDSDLPLGGHACAVLGRDLDLKPGGTETFAYVFALGRDWAEAESAYGKYRLLSAVEEGIRDVAGFWEERLKALRVSSADACVNRAVNTWIPYNSAVALELARTISTDHMGTDRLRYRDTTQDALGVANFDPAFAAERIRQVLAHQARDGGGCFSFSADAGEPVRNEPRRSDNTVWQVYTVRNLLAETGDLSLLEERVPFRDGGEATVYEHILRGLKYISERRGPAGLPVLFHADWNDGLALFRDPGAGSVMLGMQLVHACREFAELAVRARRDEDAAWCGAVADEGTRVLNSDAVWDGEWYRRLLLSSGKVLGSAGNRQGRIYLNPQSWSVISGVGVREDRGRRAMQAAAERLDTDYGLRILDPPFRGIPEPEDPPLGSNPGVGENGGIFCHANTWAMIAEAILGNAERAFRYFRQMLPEAVSAKAGPDRYEREPYVFVSSIVGPASDRFGQGGISWLTGTANWMAVAGTHYLLGVRPTLEGLRVRPCLPRCLEAVSVQRSYRGCRYEIEIENRQRGETQLLVEGKALDGTLVPVARQAVCRVRCLC